CRRVVGEGEGVVPGRVADRDPVPAGRFEVDVVGAGAPDRDHLELSARLHHPIGEAGVSPDVDGDAGGVDTLDQLGLVVGTPGGVDLRVANLATALVRGRVLEDRRKVVGDRDANG